MQGNRLSASPIRKPVRTAVTINVGSQAPAFKLLNSDMGEYVFPQPNMQKNVLLVFIPTLYIGSLFDSDGGFLRRFFNCYDYLASSKKVEMAFVTADLPFALHAAKERFKMPITLLSDPSLFVCQKYVGIVNIGKLLCYVDTANHDNREDVIESIENRQHSSFAPCLGMVLLSRTRDVLCKWVANINDNDTNPNFKQFPSNFDHWLPIATDVHAVPMVSSQQSSASLNNSGSGSKSTSNSNISNSQRGQITPTSTTGENTAETNEDKSNKKIALIVDDSSISSRIVCKKLEDMGFIVKQAFNGQIAYDQLRKSPKAFDIVLTDVVMPVCDGLTLLRLIKQDRTMEHLPVVMLSGLEGDEIIKTGLEQGAVAVLKKPFNNAEFAEIIKVKLQWT
ncbi:response regulator [archaeon]|nr:MAG: response regulator [archaeon]